MNNVTSSRGQRAESGRGYRGRGNGQRGRHPPPPPASGVGRGYQYKTRPPPPPPSLSGVGRGRVLAAKPPEAEPQIEEKIFSINDSRRHSISTPVTGAKARSHKIPCTDEEHSIVSQILQHNSTKPKREKRLEYLKKLLFKFWNNSNFPCHGAMAIASNLPDFFEHGQSTLSSSVVLLFKKWLEEDKSRVERNKSCLTDAFQRQVFDSFSQHKNMVIMRTAFQSCLLHHSSLNFLNDVKLLRQNGDFKKACELADALDLHDHFAINDFVVPLIIENNTSSVEAFLANSPKHQIEVIKFLDNLVEDNYEKVSELAGNHPNATKVNCSRLQSKALGKFIEKWLELFQLDRNLVQNHNAQRKEGSFRYLLGQREDPKMRLENWRDLVAKYVIDDKSFLEKLLTYLSRENDADEAAFWIEKLNIPDEFIPSNLKCQGEQIYPIPYEECWDDDDIEESVPQLPQKTSIDPMERETDDWNNSEWTNVTSFDFETRKKPEGEIKYFAFPLEKEDIVFITTENDYVKFIESIPEKAEVGLDCEFTTHVHTQVDIISTMQIAFKNKVYILDFLSLYEILSAEKWALLVNNIFQNGDVLKIGYGIRHDFQVLGKASNAFKGLEKISKNVLDLEIFDKKVTSDINGIIAKPYDSRSRGLSGLVEATLGLPLDKRDQISNWGRRPLSENQVVYAALDALVLLEVFKVFRDLAIKENQLEKFESFKHELIKNRNEIEKPKKNINRREKKDEALSKKTIMEELSNSLSNMRPFNENPIEPSSLKVVCDCMLQGLSRKLRMYGVNAIAIQNFETLEQCGEIAKKEGRMVLTQGTTRYGKLRSMVPKGTCLCLTPVKLEEQVKEVFRYFNVIVKEDDLFTRCVLCNSSDYITIPKDVMQELKSAQRKETIMTGVPDGWYDDEEQEQEDYFFDDMLEEDEDFYPEASFSSHSRLWVSLQGGDVHIPTASTKEDVNLLIADVPDGVLEKQETFFACFKCGKIYWEGSHWSRAANKLKHSQSPE